MNLKTKFGVLISLLVVTIISAVTVFIFVTEKQFLLDEMEQDRVNLIKSYADVARDSLVANDTISLKNYLSILKNTKGFNYAALIDNHNFVIVHTDTYLYGTQLKDEVSEKAKEASELLVQKYTTDGGLSILDLALPVYEKNVKIACVRIGFNREMLAEKVSDSLSLARKRTFLIAFVGLLVGLAGTVILTGFMVQPIKELAMGARLIGQGKLDHKIKIISRDELGDLAGEFNRMSEKLKELDQLKSDFVSSVTHELRSPLLSLRLYIDLFLKGTAGEVNEKQKEYLTIMHSCATRLHHFIDDLLDIAKIERGKMEVVPQVTDITPIITDTVQLFMPQADNKTIKLISEIPQNMPKVKADLERTRQVLTNLLSNAVKFTPENGTITIKIFVNDNHERMEVSVRDSGIGIPKDKLGIIFNKFEQVKMAKDHITGSKGTGLGLAIIKGIVEAQGGSIWVESELNVGSVFTFTLPLAK
jgi:signal transduction histidine kinase